MVPEGLHSWVFSGSRGDCGMLGQHQGAAWGQRDVWARALRREMDDSEHGLCVAVPSLLSSPFCNPKVSEVVCYVVFFLVQTYKPPPEPHVRGAPLFTTWPVPVPMLTWHKHRRRLLEGSPDLQDFRIVQPRHCSQEEKSWFVLVVLLCGKSWPPHGSEAMWLHKLEQGQRARGKGLPGIMWLKNSFKTLTLVKS